MLLQLLMILHAHAKLLRFMLEISEVFAFIVPWLQTLTVFRNLPTSLLSLSSSSKHLFASTG